MKYTSKINVQDIKMTKHNREATDRSF